jgi:hypothetical protein
MTKKRDKPSPFQLAKLGELEPAQESESKADSKRMDHTMVKCKCLLCNLHFILCTNWPERHSHQTINCPECGQRGQGLLVWQEHVDQPIFRVVPGDAQEVETVLPRKDPLDQ